MDLPTRGWRKGVSGRDQTAEAQRHENPGLSSVSRLWFSSVQVKHTWWGATGKVDVDRPVHAEL